MKTLHTTHTLQNTTERGHLALAIVGIVAAIICLFTWLHEVRSTASEAKVSQRIEALEIVSVDFSIEKTTMSVVSAMWPFRK